MQDGLKAYRESTRALVRELAFRGIVGDEVVNALDTGWDRRNRIVHRTEAGQTHSGDDLATLTAACRDLREAMALEAA